MENEGVERVAVGRVSKTFGTGGELAVTLYDTFSYEPKPMQPAPAEFPNEENNVPKEPVYVLIDKIWTPFYFNYFRPKGKNKAVVVFDDMETEHRAGELVGREFYRPLPTGQPPEPDEFSMEGLIGFEVEFEGRDRTGKVTEFIDSEFNPLLEIAVDGRVLLVPLAEEFIREFDAEGRRISLEIPEGLWDLES